MIALQCAICEKKQKLIELYQKNFSLKKVSSKTFSARRTPDRIHYRFVKCLNCGLIFSNPILPSKEIERLYKDSGFDYSLEASFLKKTYGHYLQLLLPKKIGKNFNLLDIGCGNGFFLEEAKNLGIKDVYGIEPGKPSVAAAPKWLQQRIKIGFFTNRAYKKNTFNIICCFQTLDHIVDPNVFIQNIYTALKPGGKALFIVHNTDGLSVKLFKEKSPIFDIEHIYLFNKKTLKRIFEKNKFEVIKIVDVKNQYPLSYWFRMIPLPWPLKKMLLDFLIKTKTSNTPFSIKAGNIGIIVQKSYTFQKLDFG